MTILAIGKKHDPKLTPALDEYAKRLKHYAEVSWDLVEAKTTSSMSGEEMKRAESELLLSRIQLGDKVILLDETGVALDSRQFAQQLQGYKNHATKRLVFIIGGAFGVDQRIAKRADFIWSLSKLVFPHQLVRLILAEQLYRAHTILANEHYHHE